jgi:hypothetical protein
VLQIGRANSRRCAHEATPSPAGCSHLAADALDWSSASWTEPLSLEGLQKRFAHECTFRGGTTNKLQHAVLTEAGLQGGTEPDLPEAVH